jgi:hypothetical protein
MNQVGKWKAPQAPEANIFRIFISTDNHLGYAEKNDYPPRQDDSFRAVEEVLENATAAQASTAASYARAPCCTRARTHACTPARTHTPRPSRGPQMRAKQAPEANCARAPWGGARERDHVHPPNCWPHGFVLCLMPHLHDPCGVAPRTPLSPFACSLTGDRCCLRAQADILLLGGDLFHENKPSRQCMVKAMKLFKHYVMGDRCTSARARFPWRRTVQPVAGTGHACLQQSAPSS